MSNPAAALSVFVRNARADYSLLHSDRMTKRTQTHGPRSHPHTREEQKQWRRPKDSVCTSHGPVTPSLQRNLTAVGHRDDEGMLKRVVG